MRRSAPAFLDAELIDAGAQNTLRPVDRVGAGFGRHRALGIVHLEDEVHATLEIQAQRDPVPIQVKHTDGDHRGNNEDPASYGVEHQDGLPQIMADSKPSNLAGPGHACQSTVFGALKVRNAGHPKGRLLGPGAAIPGSSRGATPSTRRPHAPTP